LQISEENDFHWLEITDITSDDAGTYTCTIQNSAGRASASAELEVFGKQSTDWLKKIKNYQVI